MSRRAKSKNKRGETVHKATAVGPTAPLAVQAAAKQAVKAGHAGAVGPKYRMWITDKWSVSVPEQISFWTRLRILLAGFKVEEVR